MKRSVFVGNPAYLSLRQKQMMVDLRAQKGVPADAEVKQLPIEDLGLLVLEHPQITLTHGLIQALQENNVAILSCGTNHMPLGLMLPLFSHTRHREVLGAQLESSKPLRKQLWAQTVSAKIKNQAAVLKHFGRPYLAVERLSSQVKSGDPLNLEARAAALYWSCFLGKGVDFYREPQGPCPNDWLNYGYAIVRAITARSLVGSGLLPAWGLFHRNKYNPYCLADDIMEPFRPWVDGLVLEMMNKGTPLNGITTEVKAAFLSLPYADAKTALGLRPLQTAIEQTTASLSQCFLGQSKLLQFPEWTSGA